MTKHDDSATTAGRDRPVEIEITQEMIEAAEAFIEVNWYPEFQPIPVEFVLGAFEAVLCASNLPRRSKIASA